MKDGIKQIIKLGIFIGLSVILLFIAFRDIDLVDVFAELKNAKYSWVLISLSAATLAYFSRARRWILLIKPLGYKPSFSSAYHAVMTGYLFNLAAPRLGELTRCVALGRKEKIPVDTLFGTVIAERAFDLVSMFIILFIMIFAGGNIMDSFLKENVLEPLGARLSAIFVSPVTTIAILILFIVAVILMLTIYRERLMKVKLFARLGDILKGIISGLKTFTRMKDKLEFLFHTLLIWTLYIIMTWVVLYAIPSTSHLHFGDAVFLLVIGTMGMAAPVQSGIGAFHWIVSRGLHIIYEISLKDGLAYATLSHESQLILIAILGSISFYIILGKKKKPRDHKAEKIVDGKE
ncbi:MAG: lysylphosphatidylglycerol synthase transmembrane domain-containing protein [Bacteroidota bacterium]|nr:lysylphosphatidylglycerol synthase transmembrane domain-containing protein [Bacteroidota bacterium]